MLPRGTGHDNIQLLWDFDTSLLQQHPSEFLKIFKAEDERLYNLNEVTKKKWEFRVFFFLFHCSNIMYYSPQQHHNDAK